MQRAQYFPINNFFLLVLEDTRGLGSRLLSDSHVGRPETSLPAPRAMSMVTSPLGSLEKSFFSGEKQQSSQLFPLEAHFPAPFHPSLVILDIQGGSGVKGTVERLHF